MKAWLKPWWNVLKESDYAYDIAALQELQLCVLWPDLPSLQGLQYKQITWPPEW